MKIDGGLPTDLPTAAAAARAVEEAGNTGADYEISVPPFVVTGHTEEELREQATITAARRPLRRRCRPPRHRPAQPHRRGAGHRHRRCARGDRDARMTAASTTKGTNS